MEQVSEEFGEKITQRDRTMRSLETDLRKLEECIQKLNLDIEEKGNEILKVRSDATRKLRFVLLMLTLTFFKDTFHPPQQ